MRIPLLALCLMPLSAARVAAVAPPPEMTCQALPIYDTRPDGLPGRVIEITPAAGTPAGDGELVVECNGMVETTRGLWENRPFWWVGPDGRDRVLYRGAQGGYSFGHHYKSFEQGLRVLLGRLGEWNSDSNPDSRASTLEVRRAASATGFPRQASGGSRCRR